MKKLTLFLTCCLLAVMGFAQNEISLYVETKTNGTIQIPFTNETMTIANHEIKVETATQQYTYPYDEVESFYFREPEDEGVLINGVVWATRNVDIPGTFATNPESTGMLYQWGSNVGWSNTDPLTASDGINTWRNLSESGDVWLPEKDPCPTGWRVPTQDEFNNLIASDNDWGEIEGINGRFFGSDEKKVFIPVPAYERYYLDGQLSNSNDIAQYWSCTPNTANGDAFVLYFMYPWPWINANNPSIRAYGFPIRCVKSIEEETYIPVEEIIDVPTTATAGTPLLLTATVVPEDATHQDIVWSIEDAGTTGATIDNENILNTTAAGTVTLRATITDGTEEGIDYTQDFDILVTTGGAEPNEEGVLINGIVWATRNLDMPGTFATNPEDAGMFYQWGSKIGWSSTEPLTATDGINTWRDLSESGDVWLPENDPCPTGWRVPTSAEFITLKQTDYATTEWITINGIDGRLIPDIATNNTIFFPAVGFRDNNSGIIYSANTFAEYWSNSPYSENTQAYYFLSFIYNFDVSNHFRACGFSIRCVKSIEEETYIPVEDIIDVPATATAGTPLLLTATVVPEDATHQDIVWSIEDAGTTGATIDNENILNTTAAGTVTLRATITDGTEEGVDYTQDFDILVTTGGAEPNDEGVLINGVVWATRNLDVGGVFCTNPEDYGALFQWGRRADGHESRTSPCWPTEPECGSAAIGVVSILDANGQVPCPDAPCGYFIRNSSSPNDWRTPQDGTLWNSGTATSPIKTVNDPCPTGWRVPTSNELESLIQADYVTSEWSTENETNGFNFIDVATGNSIFLPASGNRNQGFSSIGSIGSNGYYCSSITEGIYTRFFAFNSTSLYMSLQVRALGFSVRCVKSIEEETYIPVEDIIDVPATATVGTPLTLTATVLPEDATHQDIVWSIEDAGTTGATIENENILNTTAAGTVTLRATITDGTEEGVDYTQDFDILVTTPDPNEKIVFTWTAGAGTKFLSVNYNNTIANQFTVDWGDETEIQTFTGFYDLNHVYATSGDYTVTIRGATENFKFTYFYCLSEQITTLDISTCTGLTTLYCANNQLSSIEGIANTSLTYISCSNNRLPLSYLYDASQKVSNQSSKSLGTQTLWAQFISIGGFVDFSDQAEFGGIPTVFEVAKNGTPATASDYTINNGVITFNSSGYYVVTMTNDAIVSSTNNPAKVVASFAVKEGNCFLSNLAVSSGILTPAFSMIEMNYAVNVGNNIEEMTITATPFDPDATVVGDGLKSIVVGDNTFIITVTAQDGVTEMNYTITVNRSETQRIVFQWTGGNNKNFDFEVPTGEQFTVDWGDGSALQTATGSYQGTYMPDMSMWMGQAINPSHTYPSTTATYTVTLTGVTPACVFTGLYVAGKQLNTIDLSGATSLKYLMCGNNSLTVLDVSAHPELILIVCNSNQISVLDLSAKPNLEILDGRSNRIITVDASDNTALKRLSLESGRTENLIIGNKPQLTYLNCRMNNVQGFLDLSNCPVLSQLDCRANLITGLNVSGCPLTWLYAEDNRLSALDVSEQTLLTILHCGDGGYPQPNNHISSLDISNNVALTQLQCGGNQLSSLDISNNVALTQLTCYNNQLSSLDISNNVALTQVQCYGNHLTMSNLYTIFQKTNSTSLGPQTLPLQTVNAGKAIDFSDQAEFGGISTVFEVTQNGEPASSNDYTISNGIIKFFTPENYVVTMTNDVFPSSYYQAQVIAEFEVEAALQEISFTWNTDNSEKEITIKATFGEEFTVDWGDDAGIQSYNSINNYQTLTHTYSNAGVYTVTIAGVTPNCLITFFKAQAQELTDLDVSSCPSLTSLFCSENELTTLDVSANTALEAVNCDGNHLLLSNLYTISKLISEPNNKYLGTQHLLPQSIWIYEGVIATFDYSDQHEFEGIPTVFEVTRNGNPAAAGDYTEENGIFTIHIPGIYLINMSNAAIIANYYMPTLAVAHIDVINPWLSELSVSTGTLTPEFNSTIYYYTVDVDYSVTEITISATPFQWDAIVTGIGTHSLSVGTNIFTVTVVAAGATTDYQITVNRAAASTDATLINLTISDGTLTPIFNSNTYNYTVDVEYSVVEITITGTATDPNATVVGNGLKPIDVGENTFSITVTAQDGVTTLNYTVTVNRAYNDDATLMSLTVLPGTLTPIFNSNTYNYTVEVEYSVTEITITGTATDPNATVVGNGLKPIDVGENTFTITVTAQDGVTTLNYTVTVNRAYNDDATLMSLTVSDGTLTPVFNSNTYNYTVDVEYSVTEITITGTATDPNATVVGNGLKPLDVGENTFTITVTAQDGVTTLNYTVTVNRADNIGITEIVVGKIKIYPNPTTGELRIENGEWRMENVEIFDIYGKKVFEEKGERNKEQGDGKIVINIGDLPAGVYFLRLKNEVVKIVKL